MNFKKITSKFKNQHFLSLSGNGVMSIFGMLTYAMLCRILSLPDLGIWLFFQSIFLLVDTFRSGFLTTAFIKFYSGTENERASQVAGSAWYIAIIITLIFLLLNIPGFFISSYIDDKGVSAFLKWFGVTYLSSLPFFMATCVVQAKQRFDRLLYLRIVNQGSFIIFVLVLLFLKHASVELIIYAYLTSFVISSSFALLMGWTEVSAFAKRTKEDISNMYHFGKYSVGTTLSSNLFRTTDNFIINFMLGPSALAIYNLGARLMEVIEIPLRSFAASGMPMLAAAYNTGDKEGVIKVMKKFTGLLTMCLLPIVILTIIFADIPMTLIGGQKYVGTEAANVLRLFMTFALLFPADRFMALTLDVIHRPKVNFIKVVCMLAINLIGDFVGVYLTGNIYGIAVASFFPSLVAVVVGYFALQSYYKFNFWQIYIEGYHELIGLSKRYLFTKR